MPTLDCTARREGDVTLVACRLSNDRGVPCRIRIEPAADRIAPPRTKGVPASGWTEGRYETVVPADATVGVGFAAPDCPSDPPATLTVIEEGADPADDAAPEPTAAGAARSLLDPRPPRAAVSAGEAHPGGSSGQTDGSTGRREAVAPDDRTSADVDPAADGSGTVPAHGFDDRPDTPPGDDTPGPAAGQIPPAVGAWLARVERRGDRSALRAVAEEVATARRRIDTEEP